MSADRERGGMFTFASLFLSTLLLLSAGLLTDASRNTYRNATASSRRSDLREAAFAGGTWGVTKDAGESPKALAGRLELSGCKVKVETKRDAQGRLIVISRATNGIGESVGFELRYSAKKILEHYKLLPLLKTPKKGPGGR
ncbi:MAG: hypothetical protein JKY65_31195 [Planctomycetes bacterium]|nr:hypothetical protein [Planctomycetota bacterium]